MNARKKILGSLFLLSILILGGCSSKNNTQENSNDGSNNSLSGTINITGSTSVEKILHDMMDEFMAYNPQVRINYTGTGSSSGISDTLSKSNDIGTSSRELKEKEQIDDLQEIVFAYDGIAVVVNPKNPVQTISLEQLGKIYSGQITNWSELGGKDRKIIVVSREEASGTKTAYEELIYLEDNGGLTLDATVVEGNGTIQANVAGNENAIGYVSFAFIDESVRSVSIDGVEANAANATSGDYKLARPFLFVNLKSEESEVVKKFLEFTITDGQEFVEEHGGIRVD